MSEQRFQKTRIVDKWGGIYDTENDEILNVNDVECKLNELVKDNEELGISIKLFEDDIATKDKKIEEQQATIKKLEEENRELRQSVEYWQKKYEEGTETFQIN